ncbi:MAG: hypothetical protein BWZ06_00420 [Bacteroidetes bacterium ADurb.BinA261]|nr:MAG: hypothetical protein BWZ06_00420 [Bacteroidetes bacterium ADurb.BinA261]
MNTNMVFDYLSIIKYVVNFTTLSQPELRRDVLIFLLLYKIIVIVIFQYLLSSFNRLISFYRVFI